MQSPHLRSREELLKLAAQRAAALREPGVRAALTARCKGKKQELLNFPDITDDADLRKVMERHLALLAALRGVKLSDDDEEEENSAVVRKRSTPPECDPELEQLLISVINPLIIVLLTEQMALIISTIEGSLCREWDINQTMLQQVRRGGDLFLRYLMKGVPDEFGFSHRDFYKYLRKLPHMEKPLPSQAEALARLLRAIAQCYGKPLSLQQQRYNGRTGKVAARKSSVGFE